MNSLLVGSALMAILCVAFSFSQSASIAVQSSAHPLAPMLGFQQAMENDGGDWCPRCPKGGKPTCPAGWIPYGLNCYKLKASASGWSWSDAMLQCLADGGNLASVHSAAENQFLGDLIAMSNKQQGAFYWNGMYIFRDTNSAISGVVWTDGTPVDFGNPQTTPGVLPWLNDEPNFASGTEYCVQFWPIIDATHPSGQWNDLTCEERGYAVCKRPACACACTKESADSDEN